MIYHRVKKNLDTEYLYGNRLPPYHIIFNELYTARELDKLERKGYRVIDEYFDVVSISKSRVYWSFGARFECKH